MTQPAVNLPLPKSRGQIIFEYVLLAVSLCVIALRVTYSAGPDINFAGQPINSADILFDVTMSTLLVFSFCLWMLWFLRSKDFLYRTTGLEIGLCLFVAGTVIAIFYAPDKKAAINDSIALLAPILLTVLLVQVLDSTAKIILTLTVVAALGVVCAYQCAEQFFVSNRIIIEQYRTAPETILGPLGIVPGSFDQMLLEHRLLSNDVRGFFTTGNSAGSFLLLCGFAAFAIVLCKLKNRKNIVASLLVLAVIIFGLALSHSKGAIAAVILSALMLVTYFIFGGWLKVHKKLVLIVCLFLFLASGGLLILYGLKHGRLPGSNSMLVRWQYWQGSAKMYADHLLTGVGPGNFACFYPRYKLPAALETVTDPHNFLLNILTQFGPLGLLGFLALVLVPLFKKVFQNSSQLSDQHEQGILLPKRLFFIFALIIVVVLLIVRPLFIKIPSVAATPEVFVYAVLTLYIISPLIFLIVFRLISDDRQSHDLPDAVIAAVLFCALIGCLIHNLIDFAFFEPGIYITFFGLLACLIAADLKQISRFAPVGVSTFTRLSVTIVVLLFIAIYVIFYMLPVAKSTINIRKASDSAAVGQFEKAHSLLAAAANDDHLNPLPLSLDSRLYLNQFFEGGSNNTDLLLRAAKSLQIAIERSKADFKNYAALAEVYGFLAGLSQNQAKTDWLNKAFDSVSQAVKSYPGSSQLRIELGEIAEQLNKNDVALEQYKKAIEIEDAYRKQFEIMYRGRKVFSRLGEEKYNIAKQRIEKLSKFLNR